MVEVPRIADFSFDSFIGHFVGKDYEDAVSLAEVWAGTKITLVSYFKQIKGGKYTKSILVSYTFTKTDEVSNDPILG